MLLLAKVEGNSVSSVAKGASASGSPDAWGRRRSRRAERARSGETGGDPVMAGGTARLPEVDSPELFSETLQRRTLCRYDWPAGLLSEVYAQ